VTDKVVDTSAVAALLFDETTADSVAVRLADHRLLAPALLYIEFANVCLKKSRANPDMRDIFVAAFDSLEGMTIHLVEVDIRAVIGQAERHRLSAYDASYLWLARELDVELVTLDKKLQRAIQLS
jgi:predicted nucleic acid-binding protein